MKSPDRGNNIMCMTLMIASLAMSAVQGVAAMNQANQAAQRAHDQANESYRQAAENTKAQYAETNRKIAEENIDALAEQSDAIREANYALGTFRASETALSDASLGTIFFEQMYGENLAFSRMEKNQQRQLFALESEKTASEINYINQTTQVRNQADNQIAEANARASQAIMGAVGSGLSIGTGYYNQQATLAAMTQQ